MEKTWQMVKRLAKEEEGLEMVEYAVAAGLIVAALLVTWAALGGAINTRLQELLTAISG
ncbi:MAG: Flp family type IVb pilin [Thermodesulfobacteriota bacterium]